MLYSPQKDIKDFLLIIVAIFLSSSPLIEGGAKAAIMLILLGYLVLSLRGRFNVSSHELRTLVFAGIVFTVSMLIDFYFAIWEGLNTLSFFYFFVSFLIGFFLSKTIPLVNYMNKYEILLRYFAGFSLIIFFILQYQPEFIRFLFDYSYYHTNHKSLVLYNHVVSGRNAGFASEPGLYQFFVGLALWWRLQRFKKFDAVVLMYVLTLLTTKSTAGFFVLLVLLIPLVRAKNLPVIVLFLLVSSGIFIEEFFYHLEHKLWESKAFEGRYSPMVNAFQLLLDNPFGLGSIRYTSYLEMVDIGAFDSFTQAALRFGILGLLLLLFMIGTIAKRSIVLAIVLFITSTSQIVWLSPIMICLYFNLVRIGSYEMTSFAEGSSR